MNNQGAHQGRGGVLFFPVLYLPVVLFSLCVFAWQASYLDFVVDDVFIPLRYAENLLAGEGMVFNPGERVEGYTDFLWVLAGALLLRLPVDPLAAMRVLAFLSGAVLLMASPLLHRRVLSRGDGGASVLVAPLIALSTPLALWSSAGMETSLFALLVTAGILLSLAEGVHLAAGAVCLLLACLTRPEGHLFAVAALGGVIWRRSGEGRPLLGGTLVPAALASGIVLLAYHGWRLWYFGSILPNTFSAKVGSSGDQVARGLSYLGGFFLEGGSVLLLLPLWLLRSRRGERGVLTAGAAVLLYLAYVVLVGGDSMLAYRFVVPVLPLWLCLAVAALDDMGGAMRRTLKSVPLKAVLAGALVLALGGPALLAGDEDFMSEVRRRASAVHRWAEVGKWMKANLPGETHIALGAVGAIPFYSGFRTTDLFGLTDPVISRTPSAQMGKGFAGHERSNVERVLERNPDYILSYVLLTDEPLGGEGLGLLFRGSPAERDLWGSKRVHDLYRPAALDLEEGYLNLLARRAERISR